MSKAATTTSVSNVLNNADADSAYIDQTLEDYAGLMADGRKAIKAYDKAGEHRAKAGYLGSLSIGRIVHEGLYQYASDSNGKQYGSRGRTRWMQDHCKVSPATILDWRKLYALNTMLEDHIQIPSVCVQIMSGLGSKMTDDVLARAVLRVEIMRTRDGGDTMANAKEACKLESNGAKDATPKQINKATRNIEQTAENAKVASEAKRDPAYTVCQLIASLGTEMPKLIEANTDKAISEIEDLKKFIECWDEHISIAMD